MSQLSDSLRLAVTRQLRGLLWVSLLELAVHTHGSQNQRRPGSRIPCTRGPHMWAGHIVERVTKNLSLSAFDAEQNLMLIKGAVPINALSILAQRGL